MGRLFPRGDIGHNVYGKRNECLSRIKVLYSQIGDMWERPERKTAETVWENRNNNDEEITLNEPKCQRKKNF